MLVSAAVASTNSAGPLGAPPITHEAQLPVAATGQLSADGGSERSRSQKKAPPEGGLDRGAARALGLGGLKTERAQLVNAVGPELFRCASTHANFVEESSSPIVWFGTQPAGKLGRELAEGAWR